MKIYNTLTKRFTYAVKSKITESGELTLDDVFNQVKYDIKITYKDNEHNGYYYVDLGLPSGTMWATFNIGAYKVTDNGLLFQFGKVDGYRYKDTNHQFRTTIQNKQDTGNPSIPKTATGATYNGGAILGLEDDAAHVNMEGNWRMPKESDYNELLTNTEKTVVTVNGVKGILFTSKINGHKLFIPFIQGYWDGNNFSAFRINAYVWSSQVHSSYVYSAYMLYYDYDGNALADIDNRTDAFSVRGVF